MFYVSYSLWHGLLWCSTVNITGTLFRNLIPLIQTLGKKKSFSSKSEPFYSIVFFLPWVLQWAHRSARARFQFALEVLFRGAVCSESPPSCFSLYSSTLLKLSNSLLSLAKNILNCCWNSRPELFRMQTCISWRSELHSSPQSLLLQPKSKCGCDFVC